MAGLPAPSQLSAWGTAFDTLADHVDAAAKKISLGVSSAAKDVVAAVSSVSAAEKSAGFGGPSSGVGGPGSSSTPGAQQAAPGAPATQQDPIIERLQSLSDKFEQQYGSQSFVVELIQKDLALVKSGVLTSLQAQGDIFGELRAFNVGQTTANDPYVSAADRALAQELIYDELAYGHY